MRPTLPHRPVRPSPIAKAVLDNPSPLRPSSAVRTLSGEHLFCVRGEPLPPRCPIVYSKKNRLCSLHLRRLAPFFFLIRPSCTQNFAGCLISWQRPAPLSRSHSAPSTRRTIRSVSLGKSSSPSIHFRNPGSVCATTSSGSPLCFVPLLNVRTPSLRTNQ
jgi:hypothetical protein